MLESRKVFKELILFEEYVKEPPACNLVRRIY